MPEPRRFHLERTADPTGVSGTGHVADGIRWADGTASVIWLSDRPSIAFWYRIGDGMSDAEWVHTHGLAGDTRIVWDEGSPDQTAQVESEIRSKHAAIMDRDMSAEAQEALRATLDAALALHDATFCTTCRLPNCDTRKALTTPGSTQ